MVDCIQFHGCIAIWVMWWYLVRQLVVVAHMLCGVAVFSVVAFLHHSLESLVINVDCLCDEFVQCIDCLSVEGDFILHVFLESMSVHDYQGVVVPVSQY